MSSCVYRTVPKRSIDFQKTIRQRSRGVTLLYRPVYPLLHFLQKTVNILTVRKNGFTATALYFPPWAAGEKERQAQQFNYDHFINVMAEMMQKYAPEVLGQGGI